MGSGSGAVITQHRSGGARVGTTIPTLFVAAPAVFAQIPVMVDLGGEPSADSPTPSPQPVPTVGQPPATGPGPLPRTGADAGVLLLLVLLCIVVGTTLIRALPARRTP